VRGKGEWTVRVKKNDTDSGRGQVLERNTI